MTRGELSRLVTRLGGALRALDLGPADTIAIVMPNGPEMAATFLGAACAGIAAPLNPAYREDEFDFYLGDIAARALIIQAGPESPARAVARRRGIAIIDLEPDMKLVAEAKSQAELKAVLRDYGGLAAVTEKAKEAAALSGRASDAGVRGGGPSSAARRIIRIAESGPGPDERRQRPGGATGHPGQGRAGCRRRYCPIPSARQNFRYKA